MSPRHRELIARVGGDHAPAVPMRILIPTVGSRPTLLGLLAALETEALPPGYRGLVVIENGRGSSLHDVIHRLDPRLRAQYLHIAEGNKSAALNAALALCASEELLVFLDDDVRLRPGLLVAYHRAALAHRAESFFGGAWGVDYEAVPPDWLVPYLPPSAVGWNPALREGATARRCFIGFNWAAYCRDVVALGGFDLAFGPGGHLAAGGQETEMQRRLLRRGLRGHFVPDAWVWHWVPRSRCSEHWVMERRRRQGVQDAHWRGQGRSVIWVVTAMLRALARYGAGWVRWVASFSRERRFAGRFRMHYQIGHATGLLRLLASPRRPER
ncbi:MAG: glycosyltransferase [Chromatiales bacterium]|nr:glycosyltransferase [Chromatiales bacterium]